MSGQNSHIQLGYIQGVFGINGWLKVYSYSRPVEQILNYSTWQLRTSKTKQTCQIEDGKPHGSGIIAKLSGIDTRTQAECLVRAEIWVSAEELSELPEGEYYWYQLTGLRVVTQDGEFLGNVVRIMETGANDVLVINNDSGSNELLIPYIQDDVIKDVDLNQKLIIVDWSPDYI